MERSRIERQDESHQGQDCEVGDRKPSAGQHNRQKREHENSTTKSRPPAAVVSAHKERDENIEIPGWIQDPISWEVAIVAGGEIRLAVDIDSVKHARSGQRQTE
jgi:hypothetical protein